MSDKTQTELDSMRTIKRHLDPMDVEQRLRVLGWVTRALEAEDKGAPRKLLDSVLPPSKKQESVSSDTFSPTKTARMGELCEEMTMLALTMDEVPRNLFRAAISNVWRLWVEERKRKDNE